jgi:ABC-type antimicrobial peptide transport system permease subunit
VTFGASASALGLVAIASSAVPAWRAARVNPVTALKSE